MDSIESGNQRNANPKRRRHEEKTPRPYDGLWFADGNIVLATDDYLFKVYRGTLSSHSSVLRAKFEHFGIEKSTVWPSGRWGNYETYGGFPMVTLVGDNGKDVAHLLRAVFDRDYYHRDDHNTPLEVVVALLRLGTKYDFKGLRRDVVLQILKHYPTNLCDFETVDIGRYHCDLFGTIRGACHFPLLAEALKANVEVLLPSLFFACSEYEIYHIFEDAKCLSRDQMSRLLVGRERMVLEKAHLISTVLRKKLRVKPPNSSCSNEEFCLKKAVYFGLPSTYTTSLLDLAGNWMVKTYLSPVCESCKIVVEESVESRRKVLWDKIPYYYFCRSWDEIQRDLAEMENY